MLWSQPADASNDPLGLKATVTTVSVWPARAPTERPEAGSQSMTDWSELADARSHPSGLKATSFTQWPWPSSVLKHVHLC